MTMTEPARDTRDTGRDTPLSDEEARAAARLAWHESGGKLTGKELAGMFDRSAKWGQNQRAAAEREAAARGTDTAPPSVPRHNGTAPAPVPPPATAARSTPSAPAAAARPAAPRTPKAPASGKPAARRTGTPLPLLVVTIAAVVVVTAVCAVVSYSHIRDLAALAGAGGLSGWIPLGVDGLVVACSGSLLADRRQGRRGHPSAWAGLILGLAGTLAANVIAVDPSLVSVRVVQWVLAGYAPVALAVSGHLLLRMLDAEER